MKNFSTFPKYLFSINESVKSPFAAFQALTIFSGALLLCEARRGKQTIKEFSNKNFLQTKEESVEKKYSIAIEFSRGAW